MALRLCMIAESFYLQVFHKFLCVTFHVIGPRRFCFCIRCGVHREFVHHIVEDEVDGLEERQYDKREDGQQREESGEVAESQNNHMSA